MGFESMTIGELMGAIPALYCKIGSSRYALEDHERYLREALEHLTDNAKSIRGGRTIPNRKNNSQLNQKILSMLYDFVLDPNIKNRERKIGLMAKADIEKGRYNVAVLNQTLISLQREAMSTGLSHDASKLYDNFQVILNENVPFGTNRGAMATMSSYLDW